jgi:hypothetical protein
MESVSLFFLDDSECTEIESIHRGYRNDIYIKSGEMFYNIIAYDIHRLKQDFESKLDEDGYFDIEPNIILVREVSLKEILFTIKKLNGENYFDKVKSIDTNLINVLEDGEIIISNNYWGDRKLIRVN